MAREVERLWGVRYGDLGLIGQCWDPIVTARADYLGEPHGRLLFRTRDTARQWVRARIERGLSVVPVCVRVEAQP